MNTIAGSTLRHELRMRRHLHNLREHEGGNNQTVVYKGAAYTVTANYAGSVTYLDLLKQLLKRDIGRHRDEK